MSSYRWILSVILLFAVSLHAEANVLILAKGNQVKKGVTISLSGVAQVEGQSYNLTTVGSGLRNKKVLVALVPVYVGQLLVADASKHVKTDGMLDSVAAQSIAVKHLTFLRDLSVAKIKESFEDALDNNGVDANDPDRVAFLAAIESGGDVKSGGTLTFLGLRAADGSETFIYENASEKVKQATVKGAAGLSKKVFSMWLGETGDDSGLQAYKEELQK